MLSPTPIPRVAAIHDISGFGRCALTVIIPTLSALGVQVCPVPTAALSTHTGGFEGFTFRDLTEDIAPTFAHWRQLGASMDCVYSGFLGSPQQADIVLDIFRQAENSFLVVDPVMGDDGALYSTITPDFSRQMRRLCGKAHLITPNLTECAALLDLDLQPQDYGTDDLRRLTMQLCELGCETAVLTGAPTAGGKLANCAYERRSGNYVEVRCDRLPGSYPGTGDIFTSVLTGMLLQGKPLQSAIRFATGYLSTTIGLTIVMGTPIREGVALERTLPKLLEAMAAPESPHA